MIPEDQRAQANREELAERLGKKCVNDGPNPMADGLQFFRHLGPSQPIHGVYSPSICVIAQGAKEVQMGEDRFRYDPLHYLLCSLDLPVQATRNAFLRRLKVRP